jgi:hypothetical protein
MQRAMLDLNRRGFLTFLGGGLISAPAIVRAASLMPVRAIEPELYGIAPWKSALFQDGELPDYLP